MSTARRMAKPILHVTTHHETPSVETMYINGQALNFTVPGDKIYLIETRLPESACSAGDHIKSDNDEEKDIRWGWVSGLVFCWIIWGWLIWG
ncbi:hypothetical protein [Phaffia rhodozyma]|uniref:Uncharacterized protein n=1 Tax=Phaffia rhodozyma TaxID=264483 RepID=A0A0F7SV17_PHARH|nr:hypothetical protein [Phaffia rhodozyma]